MARKTNELIKKERIAIERFRAFEPEDGYYLCYSGGKDSDCIRILAQLAGVKHDIVNNHTTVDAPETVRYIRNIPNIKIEYPHYADGKPKTMWNLIKNKGMPPTRLARYCCEQLKEYGGKGRLKVTGVRWAESTRRTESADLIKIIGKPKTNAKYAEKNGVACKISRQGGIILNDDNDEARRLVERCYRTASTMLNPIVDWSDEDVWNFLRHYGCESNPLYQCGYKRVGCIGCPMAGKGRNKEFERYPKYKENYIRAFDKLIKARIADGKPTEWLNGEEVFMWWIGENPDQLRFEGF